MSSSTASLPVFSQLAANASMLELGDKRLRYSTFIDLATATGAEIYHLGVEVKDNAQAEYNAIVLDGLTKLGFMSFVEKVLVPLMNFEDTPFSKTTILNTVKYWMGDEDNLKTQDEEEDVTPYRPRRNVRGIPLGTIYFNEKLRALRFCLDEIRFRIWQTYDANKTKTVERTVNGKAVKTTLKVCDPSSATYRVGDRQRSSEEFSTFCSYLIDAFKYFEKFDEDLTKFSTLFRSASSAAHKIRTEGKQRAFEEKKKTLTTVKPATKPAAKPTKPAKPTGPAVKCIPAPPPSVNAWDMRKQQTESEAAEAETAKTAEAETAKTAEAEATKTAEAVEAEATVVEPGTESAETESDEEWQTMPLNKKGMRVESKPLRDQSKPPRGRRVRFQQN